MIKFEDSLLEKALTEMKVREDRLYIWGAAEGGKRVGSYLMKYGVDFKGYLVNERFAAEKPDTLLGKPVYILEDFLPRKDVDLVVGFAGYTPKLNPLMGGGRGKVYAFDFTGPTWGPAFSAKLKELINEHPGELERLSGELADDRSREALREFLHQKMSGAYSKPYDHTEQYFDPDIVKFTDGEVMADCGVYHGETALSFIRRMEQAGKRYKRIYELEPDSINAAIARRELAGERDIVWVEAAAWDSECTLKFNEAGTTGSGVSDTGGAEIRAVRLDDILRDEEVTFIKMDIEGAELAALRGAAETIRRFRPKLAICVYHKPEDLFTIPQYIRELCPDYRLYIRNYSQQGIETVLYAV